MCCVLSFAKGRCVSRQLFRRCQRIAAEVLASKFVVGYRWIVSERTFCDKESRLWERFRPGRARALDVEAYRLAPLERRSQSCEVYSARLAPRIAAPLETCPTWAGRRRLQFRSLII